jgi:hypothetical protein
VEKHRAGILAWYDFSITTGKLGGINNHLFCGPTSNNGHYRKLNYKILTINKLTL